MNIFTTAVKFATFKELKGILLEIEYFWYFTIEITGYYNRRKFIFKCTFITHFIMYTL